MGHGGAWHGLLAVPRGNPGQPKPPGQCQAKPGGSPLYAFRRRSSASFSGATWWFAPHAHACAGVSRPRLRPRHVGDENKNNKPLRCGSVYDNGLPGEAENGRDNRAARQLPKRCPPQTQVTPGDPCELRSRTNKNAELPKSCRSCSGSRDSVQIRPTAAGFGRISAALGRLLPAFGRYRPTWPMLAKCWPALSNVYHRFANFGHFRSKVAKAWSRTTNIWSLFVI